jgi:hypothetical protein
VHRNDFQTGRVTSTACLEIDQCDSMKACKGSLQHLATPDPAASNDTKLSAETRPALFFFNITSNRALALAELNDPDLLTHESFLRAQCADGYEGRLCHTCSAGWARSGKADCTSCDWPMSVNYLCVGAFAILLLAVYTFMVRDCTHCVVLGGGTLWLNLRRSIALSTVPLRHARAYRRSSSSSARTMPS